MKDINMYISGDFNNANAVRLEDCKSVDKCVSVKDFIRRGKALLALGDKDSYFDAFECFVNAVEYAPDDFEARLGEYKAWYLFSLSTKPTSWDLAIDDHYRDLIFNAPKKYRKVVASMYDADKSNYLNEINKRTGDTNPNTGDIRYDLPF